MGWANVFGRLGSIFGRSAVNGADGAAPTAANAVGALETRLAQADGVLARGTRRADEALDDARDAFTTSRRESIESYLADRRAGNAAANRANHLEDIRDARRGYGAAHAEHAAATRGLRDTHRSITSSIDDQIMRSAATGIAPKAAVEPGVLAHLGRNWKAYLGGGFGALTLATLTNNIPNWGPVRYLTDKSVGAVIDGIAGTYDNVGATGEGIIANMQTSPEYAARILNQSLGMNIVLQDGRIPDGSLREALSTLAQRGVTGSSFYQAPQIVEAYLKEQLNIPQTTDLANAVTTEATRETADVQNQTLETLAAQRRALLEGRPIDGGTGAPAVAAPVPTNSISVSMLVDPNNNAGLAGYMKNPTINLTVQFDAVSTVLRNAAGTDQQLSQEEAQNALRSINSMSGLQPNQKAAIGEVVNGAFIYGLQ